MRASHKLAEEVYKQAVPEQQPPQEQTAPEAAGQAAGQGPDGEKIIDADFEVKE